ncbi:MAG: ABC transporter permease, partial [Anaerolineae bacterium]
MRNIWLVIKHDIGVTLRQRSFWVLAFIMPLVLIGFQGYYLIQDEAPELLGAGETETEAPGEAQFPSIGLVDQARLIAEVPPDLPPGAFVTFDDEAAAREALEADEIDQYVVVPPDYLETGNLSLYDRSFQVFGMGAQASVAPNGGSNWMLDYLLAYNLVGGVDQAAALLDPVPGHLATQEALSPPASGETEEQQALATLVASIMPYIYYFLLIMASSYLMRIVVAEKENRTAELLLTRVDPRQMMVGKIAAMSLVTLLQLAIWLGAAALVLDVGGDLLGGVSFTFSPSFFVWATLFLIFGYLLYAAVMATAGALANDIREGAQMTWLLIIPLMPTLMFGQLFAEEPHGTLAVVLSLIPFSAPSAMVARLAVADVPLWQVLVSLGGLAVTAYVFVALAARFFRAGNLLSGQS